MFKGAITAIVTPFKNGRLDEAAYRELIEFQVKGGIHGIVPCGTTGESPTLSHAEHKRVVETCIDQVKKRVVVIAGSGSNNTAEALELTQHAQQAGADAALMITPYYNKPTQQGLYEHYRRVAEEVDLPLVVYNCPGRTGGSIATAGSATCTVPSAWPGRLTTTADGGSVGGCVNKATGDGASLIGAAGVMSACRPEGCTAV